MEMAKIEAIWQEVLRRRYPGVIVREDRSIPEDDHWPFLGVYMVPDVSNTKLYYARFWKEAQRELRAAKSATRSAASRSRTPARSKLREKKLPRPQPVAR